MKTIVSFIMSLFLSLNALAQAPAILDEGFESLKLDESIENLRSKLTAISADELWGEIYSPDYITSTHTYKLDSKKPLKFFGLNVEHIDVQFKLGEYFGEDEDGDGEDEIEKLETIFMFTLYMKAPSEKEYSALMTQLTNTYGVIESMTINEDDTESPNWFTNLTLLTVSGEGSYEYHDGIKYIIAEFMMASGG